MYSEITVEYMNSHKVIAYKILNFFKNTTVSYGNMNKKSFFSAISVPDEDFSLLTISVPDEDFKLDLCGIFFSLEQC